MPLIKAANSGSLMKRAVVLDVGDVARQAERLLAEAREQAREMLDDARSEARRLTDAAEASGREQGMARGREEGLAQGREEGRAAALQQARAEAGALVQGWTAALEQWNARRQQMHAEAREDVLRFAFALAERIVHRTIQADPSIVRDQLDAALHLLSRPSTLQISVHPDDRAIIEQALPELAAALDRSAHVALHDDAAIGRGGCTLATAGGYVDATVGTQLDRLAEALLQRGRIDRPPPAPADAPTSR